MEKQKGLWKIFIFSALSFIISGTVMAVAFAKSGVHPFGNQQILVVDLWHQYYPFFRVLREKLLTGGSFLYSWENGYEFPFAHIILCNESA